MRRLLSLDGGRRCCWPGGATCHALLLPLLLAMLLQNLHERLVEVRRGEGRILGVLDHFQGASQIALVCFLNISRNLSSVVEARVHEQGNGGNKNAVQHTRQPQSDLHKVVIRLNKLILRFE